MCELSHIIDKAELEKGTDAEQVIVTVSTTEYHEPQTGFTLDFHYFSFIFLIFREKSAECLILRPFIKKLPMISMSYQRNS